MPERQMHRKMLGPSLCSMQNTKTNAYAMCRCVVAGMTMIAPYPTPLSMVNTALWILWILGGQTVWLSLHELCMNIAAAQ